MTDTAVYVPVLKGKEGEYSALEVLSDDVRAALLPLIDVPEIPFDYAADAPAKSAAEHVGGVGERLARAWGTEQRLFVDLHNSLYQSDTEGAVQQPLALLFDGILRNNVKGVPVTGLSRPRAYQEVVKALAARTGLGVCLRIVLEDFDEENDIGTQIDDVVSLLAVAHRNIDVVVDMNALGDTPDAQLLMVARSCLGALPSAGSWRTVTLVASAFPENLSDVDSATLSHIARREWIMWKGVRRRPERVPVVPQFGDYAISHPEPPAIDPRVMRMSASIRYTTSDSWLIIKGRNVRDYGFGQYHALCKELVSQDAYCGSGFSWGDEFISKCALGETGPGNATTWRKVGTNHHLTFVVRQLATLDDS